MSEIHFRAGLRQHTDGRSSVYPLLRLQRNLSAELHQLLRPKKPIGSGGASRTDAWVRNVERLQTVGSRTDTTAIAGQFSEENHGKVPQR